MWLALLVLFVALSPGVLFTLPAFGKKMGGKFVIALMHSLLFVVVVGLLNVMEGFQAKVATVRKLTPRYTPEQTLANAENRLNGLTTQLENLKAQVVLKTKQLEEGNTRVAQLRQQLQQAQESAQAAQNRVAMKNEELSNAQKEVLDTTARMNMIANQVAAASRGKVGAKGGVMGVSTTSIQQQLTNLNRSINSTNTSIISAQNAVTAAKLAMNATNTVKQVEQAPASMNSGSRAQDVAQATEVAVKAQVDAEKAVRVADNVTIQGEIDAGSSGFQREMIQDVRKSMEEVRRPVDNGGFQRPAPRAEEKPPEPTPTIASIFGYGPKTISIIGDSSPTAPPPQRMPMDLCPRGSWPLMSNGVDDGTGSNTYTSVCTPCSTSYTGNDRIPANINYQNYSNKKFTCSSF